MEKTKSKLRNTILIGPNGIGKTSFLKQIKKNAKKAKVFDLLNENLKDSLDGKSSNFSKFLEELKKEIKNKLKEDEIKKLENKENLKKINDNHKQDLKEDIEIVKEFSIQSNIENNWDINYKIIFNNREYEIKNLPSGMRRILEFYITIKDHESKNEAIILLDEIDNFLHPNYIKLISQIIIKFFNNKKFKTYISTHNSELLYLLNDYIHYIGIPVLLNNIYDVRYLDLKDGFCEYNKILEIFKKDGIFKDDKYLNIDLEKYKLKIQTRFSMQLTRFLFSKDETVIICEGITDQMYFKKQTENLVINSFGVYNLPLYLSLFKSLYGTLNKNICFILDGDGNNDFENFKEYLKEQGIIEENIFIFDNCIEKDLYNYEGKKLDTIIKFQLLEKNIDEKELLENEKFKKLKNILSTI